MKLMTLFGGGREWELIRLHYGLRGNKYSKDMRQLIQLLNHRDYEVQWREDDALGTLGSSANSEIT